MTEEIEERRTYKIWMAGNFSALLEVDAIDEVEAQGLAWAVLDAARLKGVKFNVNISEIEEC